MPLVDDDTLRTDRRSATWWPWVLVALGFILLWLIFAAVISIVPRVASAPTAPAPAPSPVQTAQSNLLRQAQQVRAFGSAAQAISMLEQIDPNVPMSLSDKHTYFRVAAESYRSAGNPAKSAEFSDRFLSFSIRIHSPECRSCHESPATLPPTRLADMLESELGTAYVAALREARKLRTTRDTLARQLSKKPDDLRLRLLLYHLETALENSRSAEQHAAALRKADDATAVAAPDTVR